MTVVVKYLVAVVWLKRTGGQGPLCSILSGHAIGIYSVGAKKLVTFQRKLCSLMFTKVSHFYMVSVMSS